MVNLINIIDKEIEFEKALLDIKSSIEIVFNKINTVDGMGSGKCFTVKVNDVKKKTLLPHDYSLTFQKNILLKMINKSCDIESIKMIIYKVISHGKIEVNDVSYGKKEFKFNTNFVKELSKSFEMDLFPSEKHSKNIRKSILNEKIEKTIKKMNSLKFEMSDRFSFHNKNKESIYYNLESQLITLLNIQIKMGNISNFEKAKILEEVRL